VHPVSIVAHPSNEYRPPRAFRQTSTVAPAAAVLSPPEPRSSRIPHRAKPSAADLRKAAAVDLDGFDDEVTLDTSAGPIRLRLDAPSAPGHARTVVALAESGFYDGGCFHRIIKGFMIQGGCPEGTGTGGPGYQIEAEFNATPHEPGVLSMARTNDPNSAGSQFFICLERVPHLDRKYTAFGRTADDASLEVVKKIGAVKTLPGDKPVERVTITKATVAKTPKKQ
jgi:peptidyl-prolyl cis-trans isomerase B (cyclophilin B)